MAQTGYTPILIYSSSTAAAAPVAGNLTNSTLGSELAINITDCKLFYKDNANAIQVIGWKVVPTTAGGTGLTSFTANQVFYASSSSAIGQSANLTFNGTTLGVGGAVSASRAIFVQSTGLTGTTQTGVFSNVTGSSAATSNIDAFRATPASAAAAFTVTNMSGLRITDGTKGAGSTITSLRGILIDDQTQGNTNNIGIDTQVSSGANKWNIYASGTAANYFAGQAQFANGSVGTPSISNINDTNTGIFFPAADTIGFVEGGVEVARFDNAANFGVGTTSPVAIGANYTTIDIRGSSGGGLRMGTTSTSYAQLYGNSGGMNYDAVGTHFWYVGSVEGMRLNATGLGVGTTNPATTLHANGTIRYTNRPAAGTITAIGFDANGNLKASSSSLRYKHDIEDYNKGIETLMQLRPVSFKFNGEERTNIGFIAEEVDALGLSEVMLYNEEEQPEGVIYANMVSLLTKAIQEQQHIIDELKIKVAALEKTTT